SDKITLLHFLYSASDRWIESVEFADNSSVSRDDIMNGLLGIRGTSSADTLSGTSWNEQLLGLGGDDTLYGGLGLDTLVGGTGNDWLQGGPGNDVYLFSEGDGQDTVYDYNTTVGNSDKLLFDSSVGQSVVAIFKNASGDLQIGYTD